MGRINSWVDQLPGQAADVLAPGRLTFQSEVEQHKVTGVNHLRERFVQMGDNIGQFVACS